MKVSSCSWFILFFGVFYTQNSPANELTNSSISLIDTQHNNTTWAASNLLDNNSSTHWLSSQQRNDLNFQFVNNDEAICLAEFHLTNYGYDTSSVKQFVLLTTLDDSLNADSDTDGWRPVIADANPTQKIDYLSWAQGARLVAIDSEHNSTSWGARNLNDGSTKSRWLSNKANNTIEYNFDTDWDGTAGDGIPISEFEVVNYGDNPRSVKEFQLEVTQDGILWNKLIVPGSNAGDSDYIYTRGQNGGKLGIIDSQHNSSSWGAKNIHDGDTNSRWLSNKANNTIEFTFDPNNDGITSADGDTLDVFDIDEFRFQNYGANERSVKEFQVAVQTLGNIEWQKIRVPGALVGSPNYNFALSHHGAKLVEIDSQHDTTTWGADNIHDGDSNSRWLSNKSNNTLAFQFDVDEDSVFATNTDLFTFDRFYLQNYGIDGRAIKEFQVAVKTSTNPSWKKIAVSGSAPGVDDFNFALAQHGGTLVDIDSQHNSTSWAAKNIHDGDVNSRWLSTKGNNTLDFQFDLDEDGITGTAADQFTLESFHLVNYGANDRAINEFQVEVKTASNSNWLKLPVSGTNIGDANHPFSLSSNGGTLSAIDSEYNSTSYAAKNLHDGDQNSAWLSNKQNNTLEFTFDTDNNQVGGDSINFDSVKFINYGVNDVSVQTFEIDIQISGGLWQTIPSPQGGNLFTANMDSVQQTWSIGQYSNVTAARIRTLTNFGDSSYTGARELTFSGDAVGPSYTFTAAMNSVGETFVLDAQHQAVDVTDVRLRTINNHGDSSYIGAKEFKLQGISVTQSYTFSASMHGDGETFTLDGDDVPVDVTDVKLITISNYGDPSYTGAREFKLLGPSITETKTFVADMHGNEQVYNLDLDDIPVDVTAVKLITISNYGDPSYSGMKEFEVVGESIVPSTTFTLPNSAVPYSIVLDPEDQMADIIGVRIQTIQNYGDPSYTGLSEFKIMGTAISPSYIFNAANTTNLQTFGFEPTSTNVFRFHSLNNFGDQSYIRATEFGVQTGICKTAQWRMEDASWSGALNEVVDSSGSGYNGVAFGFNEGDNPITTSTSPAITTDPGTCKYGEFDGVDDHIIVDTGDILDDLTELTVSAWIKANSFNQTNGTDSRGIFSKVGSSDSKFSYAAFFNNSSGSQLNVDITGDNDRFVSNTIFNVDTWYHIAIVFDASQSKPERVKLYVNGVLDGTFTESSNEIPDTIGDFYIATLYSTVNQKQVFDGAIDEVNIKPNALQLSEITDLMNKTRPCTASLHHIQIEHDDSGLTCSPEPLTIKACANADCTMLIASDVNVTLAATGSNSSWSENPITIPAGQSVAVELTHTTAELITLGATANINPSHSLICSPNCDIEFFDSGYLLTLANHQSCDATDLTIQAVKLSDTNTNCAPAYTGDQSIDFTFNYDNPTTGSIIPLLAGATMAAHEISQNRTVNFDATGTATLSFEYQDAGRIQLDVRDATDSGLSPSSLTSVVSPAKLIVASSDINAECISGDASCSAFKKAGELFNLSLTAACSDNTVTPNFEMSDIPLSIQTVAPLLGNPVSLGVTSIDFSASDNGIYMETNQSVSEVGVFTITATPPLNAYFGETIPTAISPNIGRFTPDSFDLQVTFDGILSGGDTFVYSGQMSTVSPTQGQLSYAVEPEFTMTAKALSGLTTRNYTGDFMKMQATSVTRLLPVSDNSQLGADGINKLELTATLYDVSLSEDAGVITYKYAENDHFVYTRNTNALIAPFDNEILLRISAIADDDDITANDIDNDISNGILNLNPIGQEIRFGRLFIENSFGPETSNIAVLMFNQYWDGTRFVTNRLDSFTAFDTSSNVTIADVNLAPASTSVLTAGLDYFDMGQAEVVLSSPGEGNQGDINFSFEPNPWLQYNWTSEVNLPDELFDDNPSAIVSFGLYRGDDRTLHWREVFQ